MFGNEKGSQRDPNSTNLHAVAASQCILSEISFRSRVEMMWCVIEKGPNGTQTRRTSELCVSHNEFSNSLLTKNFLQIFASSSKRIETGPKTADMRFCLCVCAKTNLVVTEAQWNTTDLVRVGNKRPSPLCHASCSLPSANS